MICRAGARWVGLAFVVFWALAIIEARRLATDPLRWAYLRAQFVSMIRAALLLALLVLGVRATYRAVCHRWTP